METTLFFEALTFHLRHLVRHWSERVSYPQELLRAEQSVEAGLWEKGGSVMRAGCRGLTRLKAKEGVCDTLLEDLQALEARCSALSVLCTIMYPE